MLTAVSGRRSFGEPIRLFLILFVLAGCASAPEYSREQWLAAATRTYADHSADQVLAAAQEVIRLSDPDDVTFEHAPDGLVARRAWSFYGGFTYTHAVEIWRITAKAGPDGTAATAAFEGDTTGFGAAPPYGPASPEVYSLLWDRVDYMLGLHTDWEPCGSTWNNVGLCGAFVEELKPE